MLVNTENRLGRMTGVLIIGVCLIFSALLGQDGEEQRTEEKIFRVQAKVVFIDSSEFYSVKYGLLEIIKRLDTNSSSICQKRFVVNVPCDSFLERGQQYIFVVHQVPRDSSEIVDDSSLYPAVMRKVKTMDDCYAPYLQELGYYQHFLREARPIGTNESESVIIDGKGKE